MTKIRVYELAKELNTSSKRLMEKLAEIKVIVKNHMSLLQDNELEALYKHVGVVKHEGESVYSEHHQHVENTEPIKTESGKDIVKAKKNTPTIIRTTEIIIDTKNDHVKTAGDSKYSGSGAALKDDSEFKLGIQSIPHRKIENDSVELANVTKLVENPNKSESVKEDLSVNNASKNLETKTSDKVIAVESDKKNLNTTHQGVNNFNKNTDVRKPSNFKQNNYNSQGGKFQGNRSQGGNFHNNRSQDNTSQNRGVSGNRNYGSNNSFGNTGNTNNNHNAHNAYNTHNAHNTHNNNTHNFKHDGENIRHGYEKSALSHQNNNKFVEPNKHPVTDSVHHNKVEHVKREVHTKDFEKDTKKDLKKEIVKSNPNKSGKFNTPKIVLGEKKDVSEALSEEYILDEFYGDTTKIKKNLKNKRDLREKPEEKYVPPKAVLTSVIISDTITVKEFAEAMKKPSVEVIKKLMNFGIMATLNQEIDFDTAVILGDEFKIKVEKEVVVNEEDILFDDNEEDPLELEARPPVVVVMGHVDHGKTSLLDAIRKTNVIASEAGGITQHIGAYTVKINNRNITFLDTPGHEAFTAMRARGAQVTDIAILVVAADDGVMPQTIEAIDHAKAANVSIIVAINKIDKPGANPDRVIQELAQYGLVSEEWGGDIICVPLSAKKMENIDHLLEMVLLTADMLELKSNPNSQAKGTVIEAKLDKDRGPVATVLVQRGTLKVSDSIVTGTTVGRIRAMHDDKYHKIKKAGPSSPVEILGLSSVPEAGEVFYAITDERVAKQLVEKRKLKQREDIIKAHSRVTLDDLFNQIKEGKVKDLNLIVKADVQGSVEAVKQSLAKLHVGEVRVKIIHGAVGAITESDVTLAQVSNAIIIGFNVRPSVNILDKAKESCVDIRVYRVIYKAIEDIEAAMKGMLEPTFKEVIQGHFEIRQIFKVSGIGTIGGAYVTDGKISRNADVRIIRDGIVVYEGKLASLKRFKDDAKEVATGFECGVSIEKYNDIRVGDIIESFVMEEVER